MCNRRCFCRNRKKNRRQNKTDVKISDFSLRHFCDIFSVHWGGGKKSEWGLVGHCLQTSILFCRLLIHSQMIDVTVIINRIITNTHTHTHLNIVWLENKTKRDSLEDIDSMHHFVLDTIICISITTFTFIIILLYLRGSSPEK